MSDEDDEKRQRQMDFIVETLARLTVTVERTAETQAQHIEETKRRDDEAQRRDDEASERIARFERSYVAISELLVSHDRQLVDVTEGLNRLTVVVERYIASRGNSNNGA